MAFKNWVNGENLDSADLNGNFDYVQRKLNEDKTGASTSTAAYVKIGEISIGAGIVANHILIAYDISTNQIWASSGNYSTANHDLRVGEAGSETSKEVITLGGGDFSQNTGQHQKTQYYYYEPTADEKTNGFNIQVYGKYTNAGVPGSNATASYNKMIILGG